MNRRKKLGMVTGLGWAIPVGVISGIFIDWIKQNLFHLLIMGLLYGIWAVILILVIGRSLKD